MVINTQEQLDNAPINKEIVIELATDSDVVSIKKPFEKVIVNKGKVFTEEETYIELNNESTCYCEGNTTVIARKHSKVSAKGNCRIKGYGTSKIDIADNTTAKAFERCSIYAKDNCQVKGYDYSEIVAVGKSDVDCSDFCICIIKERATAILKDKARGDFYNNSYGYIKDNAEGYGFDNARLEVVGNAMVSLTDCSSGVISDNTIAIIKESATYCIKNGDDGIPTIRIRNNADVIRCLLKSNRYIKIDEDTYIGYISEKKIMRLDEPNILNYLDVYSDFNNLPKDLNGYKVSFNIKDVLCEKKQIKAKNCHIEDYVKRIVI